MNVRGRLKAFLPNDWKQLVGTATTAAGAFALGAKFATWPVGVAFGLELSDSHPTKVGLSDCQNETNATKTQMRDCADSRGKCEQTLTEYQQKQSTYPYLDFVSSELPEHTHVSLINKGSANAFLHDFKWFWRGSAIRGHDAIAWNTLLKSWKLSETRAVIGTWFGDDPEMINAHEEVRLVRLENPRPRERALFLAALNETKMYACFCDAPIGGKCWTRWYPAEPDGIHLTCR